MRNEASQQPVKMLQSPLFPCSLAHFFKRVFCCDAFAPGPESLSLFQCLQKKKKKINARFHLRGGAVCMPHLQHSFSFVCLFNLVQVTNFLKLLDGHFNQVSHSCRHKHLKENTFLLSLLLLCLHPLTHCPARCPAGLRPDLTWSDLIWFHVSMWIHARFGLCTV